MKQGYDEFLGEVKLVVAIVDVDSLAILGKLVGEIPFSCEDVYFNDSVSSSASKSTNKTYFAMVVEQWTFPHNDRTPPKKNICFLNHNIINLLGGSSQDL